MLLCLPIVLAGVPSSNLTPSQDASQRLRLIVQIVGTSNARARFWVRLNLAGFLVPK